MESISNEWIEQFRSIVTDYNNRRQPDPFMQWFRKHEIEGCFKDTHERVLAVLIDSRFDQDGTTAQNALENTVALIKQGALRKILDQKEIPKLNGTQHKTSEEWASLFAEAAPKLNELALEITKRKNWDALELLTSMAREYKVPYLGVKTSRLAVRWLHELVPAITIEMNNYKIPIDRLVYRVASRLGIVDPGLDKYSGNGSPADLKIQSFVRQAFPTNAWIVDEPLWSTGRRRQDRGHCYPTNPNCYGCIFQKICPNKHTKFDPAKVGMELITKDTVLNEPKQVSCGIVEPIITKQQTEFRELVEQLKQQGIHGEEYREKIAQWNREHKWGV